MEGLPFQLAGSRASALAILAIKARFDSNELARILGISDRHLRRLSREILGRSIHDWLNEQRCLAAAQLLRLSRSAKQTGFHLDFKQLSHFCRTFKRYTGVTPMEYLRLLGERRFSVQWAPPK